MAVLLRVFFTGAFRMPREFNWIIGLVMLAVILIVSIALGMLQLDGTGNAITAEQAKTLLTLWQALRVTKPKRRVGASRSQRAARPDRRRAHSPATRCD